MKMHNLGSLRAVLRDLRLHSAIRISQSLCLPVQFAYLGGRRPCSFICYSNSWQHLNQVAPGTAFIFFCFSEEPHRSIAEICTPMRKPFQRNPSAALSRSLAMPSHPACHDPSPHVMRHSNSVQSTQTLYICKGRG